MTPTPDGSSTRTARHRAYVGPALLAVCALHIVVGLIDASPLLADAAGDGWAGAFTGDRSLAMWFLMTGAVGAVAGIAITVVERGGTLPWSISIALLIVSAIGVSMAPTSGFVLILAVALLAIVRSLILHRQRQRSSATRR